MTSMSLSSINANAIVAVAQQRVAGDKLNVRLDERQLKLDQDRLDKDSQRVSAEKKLAQQTVASDPAQLLNQSLAKRAQDASSQTAKLVQQTVATNPTTSGTTEEPVTIGAIINTHA